MFALLSHELRTPLNGVLGMASLLAATDLDPTQTAYLHTLRDCGEHLLNLVNNTLNLAKLEAGQVELDCGEVDPESLLQSVCELLSPRAYAQGLEIAWAVQAGVPKLLADDGRLRQILFNLAGNAVKLTAKGGVRLALSSWPAAAEGTVIARFEVRDTGPGLAPEETDRIFEEFVQAQAGAQAGGAGLGLAIVKRLAEAMDGRLGVDSAPGRGAVFWFEAQFPVAGPAAPEGDLAGVRVGVEASNVIVREAASAQILAAGGTPIAHDGGPRSASGRSEPCNRTGRDIVSLRPFGSRGGDATTGSRRVRPDCDVLLVDGADQDPYGLGPRPAPTLVLLAPEARDRIGAYRQAGYAGYLIKPLRRASLVAQVLAALQREAPQCANMDERASPARAEASLRVLLAEDNAVNALLARAMLTRAGCVVEPVATGEAALAALAQTRFDVVFMDVRMPGMGGLEATRVAREGGFAGPIVALTANAFEDDRRACRQAGMSEFLSKPMDAGALWQMLDRIRAAIRQDG